METFLIRALQLILCFSMLIILHEGGHFFAARLFGVRVERFCLFFDPWFTLFKFKPKRGGTTYALGWLPLGGYVKISGMIDESLDTAQMKEPVKPWEFRAKPAWQRLVIMVAGVAVNFAAALVIYSMILYVWGETYTPVEKMTYGMKFNDTARRLGFRDGDILVGTDKAAFRSFDSSESVSEVYRALSEASQAKVLRGGREVTIRMPGSLNMLSLIREAPPFVQTLFPSEIDSVLPSSPAAKAGIAPGDRITAFCGRPVSTWNEINDEQERMRDELASAGHGDSLRLRRAEVAFVRAGSLAPDTASVTLTADCTLGVTYGSAVMSYPAVTRTFGFFESFPAGARRGAQTLGGYVDDLKYVFTKDGAQSVGSFGAIGSLFPAQWDWRRFWELTAFISIILAFMNILPVPALDGGHVMFLAYEAVARRKPSEKFMERTQMIGMGLLALLMLWAISNDIRNFLL